jgi:hypothetical protein
VCVRRETDVSEERIACIFRVEEKAKEGTRRGRRQAELSLLSCSHSIKPEREAECYAVGYYPVAGGAYYPITTLMQG